MKRIYLFFILILTAYVSAHAQQTPAETTAPQSEDKAAWASFTPDFEEFSVEAPTPFQPDITYTADPQSIAKRSYRTYISGTYCYVFSDPLKDPFQTNKVFDFAGEAANRNLENVVFKFTDSSGYHHRILTVKTTNRVYTFQTFGETENNQDLERFFRGIKINVKATELKKSVPPVSRNTQAATTNNTVSTTPDVKTPASSGIGSGNGIGRGTGSGFGIGQGNGRGTGSGVGTGNGNGLGNGVGNGSAPEPPKNLPIPLKLISKPRPSYTDYARFYHITGVIRLKVTFLASGEIGTITPVSKLPFGLTEQAIAVARQIRFEPQQINGQRQSVSKIIEYSFSIY